MLQGLLPGLKPVKEDNELIDIDEFSSGNGSGRHQRGLLASLASSLQRRLTARATLSSMLAAIRNGEAASHGRAFLRLQE